MPETLLPFLKALLAKEKDLQIHILSWDFSLLYVWERELLARSQFGWEGHDARLTFRLDGKHPAGASHHQKIVVVDDVVAFSGGLDLTLSRWDTPEHLPKDPRRVTPNGESYGTMHDAQIGVTGDAAAKLGELFRARWVRATEEPLPAPEAPRAPIDLAGAELENHAVGVSRTSTDLDGAEVREVQALTLRAIASAQRYIMIENQYLSSAVVGDALAERLRDPDGPEVLVILPRAESGWLEQESMGLLKQRLLRKLRRDEKGGRLRVLYPATAGVLEGGDIYVHSKILLIDDEFAKIGSSNLSNRSMSLDTECDISIECGDDKAAQQTIQNWKFRLLGEHLGRDPQEVRVAVEQWGLCKAVDRLAAEHAQEGRTLKPVPETPEEPPAFDFSVYDGLVSDPEKPLSPELLMGRAMPERQRKLVRGTLVVYAVASVAVLGFLAYAKFFAADGFVDDALRWTRANVGIHAQTTVGVAWLLAAVFVVSCLFFPLSVTIAAVCIAAPGWRAFVILYGGALASAVATYWIGRSVKVPLPSRLNRKAMQLQHKLKKGGFLAVLLARLVPVGSFTLINGVAGMLKIPFPAYILANAVGLVPGILLLSMLSGRLAALWNRASWANLLMAGGAVALMLGAFAFIGYLVRRQGTAAKPEVAQNHNLATGVRR